MKNINMKKWLADYLACPEKKPFPILTFPCVSVIGTTVNEIVKSSDLQAKGMEYIAEHTAGAAVISFMDLSVEAEAFGAEVRYSGNEVPTVVGHIIESEDDAEALQIPKIGTCRTGIYVDAVKKATELITDRPVFAGMIGPFSLAARLFGVSEIMMECYDNPDTVHTVLEKTMNFLISYAKSFCSTSAAGIMIAEPVSGLLSPALESEFSAPYVKKIVDAVRSDSFLTIYHNCGGNAVRMIPSLVEIGADAYHFGNAVDICEAIEKMPKNTLVLGNIDPSSVFCLGTPESVRNATLDLLGRASVYPNFALSSGCDIPPKTPWENIDAFFGAAEEFYKK